MQAHDMGDVHEVRGAGFIFEAGFSQGWAGEHGLRGMPEHYGLNFKRQFEVGDAGVDAIG